MAVRDNQKKERKVCVHCSKKRYAEHMEQLFIHPVICEGGVWACRTPLRGWRARRNFTPCIEPAIAELMLYANTGMLNLIPSVPPAKKAANAKRK